VTKFKDADMIGRAEEIFEMYFALGFLGRSALNVSEVKRLSGYEGRHQGFYRDIWQVWLDKKVKEDPETMKALEELKEGLKNG
jgi:hypothetical protein